MFSSCRTLFRDVTKPNRRTPLFTWISIVFFWSAGQIDGSLLLIHPLDTWMADFQTFIHSQNVCNDERVNRIDGLNRIVNNQPKWYRWCTKYVNINNVSDTPIWLIIFKLRPMFLVRIFIRYSSEKAESNDMLSTQPAITINLFRVVDSIFFYPLLIENVRFSPSINEIALLCWNIDWL